MKKKHWLLAAAMLIGLVFLIGALLPYRAGVTKANFDRIEDGMSKPEVVEILGEPSTDQLVGAGLAIGHTREVWTANEGFVGALIVFDEQVRVFQKDWVDHTFLGRVRHVLPWFPL